MTAVWRLALLAPVGLAIYACVSHVAITAGWPLPWWLFPGAFLLAGGIVVTRRPPSLPLAAALAEEGSPRTHKVWPCAAALGLVLITGIVTYGAVATTDREWDGLVSWSLRAAYLAPPADVSHPFFTDHAVLAHTKSYPMLQPLCLGASTHLLGDHAGRLFFPALFVAFLLLVGAVGRLRGLAPGAAWCLALVFGATPMWFGSGSGAVDSGYAELSLGFFLAVAAAGLLVASPMLVVCALFCLPLTKPEGLPYGVLLCTVTAFSRETDRRVHAAATVGLVAALVLWIPLQARFLGIAVGALGWGIPVAGGAVLLAVGEAHRRWPLAQTLGVRGGWMVAAGFTIALTLAILVPGVLTDPDEPAAVEALPSLQPILENLREIPHRLTHLPRLLYGYVFEGFLFVRKFGLLFPIALFLLCFRPSWSSAEPHRPLAACFVGGLAMCCLAIFLADDTNWEHQFESRFDRLLLQWVGVGWLLVGPWLGREFGLIKRRSAGD